MKYLILALLICLLILSAPVAAEKTRKPYRCFRPFKALDAFSPKFMNPKANCEFDYFSVLNATAVVACSSTGGAEPSATAGASKSDTPSNFSNALPSASTEDFGCRVTVSVWGRLLPTRDKLVLDAGRFSLKLSTDGKHIHYKGFNGNGYSLCCGFLSNATCEWNKINGTSKQEIHHCQLHPTGQGESQILFGSVTKPLPGLINGDWDAHVNFFRGSAADEDLVGRLSIPFVVEVPTKEASPKEARSDL